MFNTTCLILVLINVAISATVGFKWIRECYEDMLRDYYYQKEEELEEWWS